MKQVLIRRPSVYLSIALLSVLFYGIYLLASPFQAEKHAETKVPVFLLQRILATPSIQQELDLEDEQIAKLGSIKPNPLSVPFAEAIKPIKAILDPWQFELYMRTVYQGLMVRAFRIRDVESALELTPEQKEGIASIQSKLKANLQPFQDKIKSREFTDPIALERDTSLFHEEAYTSVLDLLTEKQLQKWERLSKPVPLRNPKGK